MTAEDARRRFAGAPVARLATTDPSGRPHLVPIVFAVVGDTIYSAVDSKPKRTTELRRLGNVVVNPAVAVLVDHYDDDWDQLWWVRADGTGRVLGGQQPEHDDALAELADRYPQYHQQRPAGPVLAINVNHWSGWSAADG